jgi:uncharacterized protein involved in exopolysaccharide biosynthesis
MQEDEIDLKELIRTILKYKKFIVIFTLVVVLVASLYAFLKTPIYEIKSNIRIGYIGSELLESPDIITRMLQIVFHVDKDIKKEKNPISEVTEIDINQKLKDFITVTTAGISNEEALKKNKEVVSFLQKYYQPKIEQYIQEKKNAIDNTQREIFSLENFERKNIEKQIDILKKQKIAQIDEKIKKLKTQDIMNLQQRIDILKKQKIVKINEEIEFLQKKQLESIKNKINFHQSKLQEYSKEIGKLSKQMLSKKDDTSLSAILSIQMVNYQNLILNSQNKLEDLMLKKDDIVMKILPNLERSKENIKNVEIKNLIQQIENIQNIQIVNLEREKENISSDDIRKLQYKLDVGLKNQKINLEHKIEQLRYDISSQNVQNSDVVGEYIIDDSPTKPKKVLIIAVSFVTGFIFSIFLVFLMEFIKGMKEEK